MGRQYKTIQTNKTQDKTMHAYIHEDKTRQCNANQARQGMARQNNAK